MKKKTVLARRGSTRARRYRRRNPTDDMSTAFGIEGIGAAIGLVFGALTPSITSDSRIANGLLGASSTSGLVAIGGLGAALLEPRWRRVGLVTAGVGLGGALLFILASVVTANITNAVPATT